MPALPARADSLLARLRFALPFASAATLILITVLCLFAPPPVQARRSTPPTSPTPTPTPTPAPDTWSVTYSCPQNSNPANASAGPITISGPEPDTSTWHKNYHGTNGGSYGGGSASADPPLPGGAELTGYGSVGCGGDIVATVHWNGGPNNDPPPPAVLLKEDEEADWDGQPSGTAVCDLPSRISGATASGASLVDEIDDLDPHEMYEFDLEEQYTIIANPPVTFTLRTFAQFRQVALMRGFLSSALR